MPARLSRRRPRGNPQIPGEGTVGPSPAGDRGIAVLRNVEETKHWMETAADARYPGAIARRHSPRGAPVLKGRVGLAARRFELNRGREAPARAQCQGAHGIGKPAFFGWPVQVQAACLSWRNLTTETVQPGNGCSGPNQAESAGVCPLGSTVRIFCIIMKAARIEPSSRKLPPENRPGPFVVDPLPAHTFLASGESGKSGRRVPHFSRARRARNPGPLISIRRPWTRAIPDRPAALWPGCAMREHSSIPERERDHPEEARRRPPEHRSMRPHDRSPRKREDLTGARASGHRDVKNPGPRPRVLAAVDGADVRDELKCLLHGRCDVKVVGDGEAAAGLNSRRCP